MYQQYYLTHCTHGSSALERKTDEMASYPLGYNVRSGSESGKTLRESFRRLERYVYYYLPEDTPGEIKDTATAKTSPIRLAFWPSSEGAHTLGQIMYRTKDTAGRPGSYFAHMLIRSPQASAPGTTKTAEKNKDNITLQAIQLWGASGWVIQDTPDLKYDIPELKDLNELMELNEPLINDTLLTSFLTTSADGEFSDPGNVIPQRWKNMPVSQRVSFIEKVLHGGLFCIGRKGSSLVVVAEPSITAVAFYALARILPTQMTAKLGFSTYETDMERLSTRLVGTTFYDPTSHDLEDKYYKLERLTIINSYNQRSTTYSESPYITNIMRIFTRTGLSGVDTYLTTFNTLGVNTVQDLNALISADSFIPRIFQPKVSLTPEGSDIQPKSPETEDISIKKNESDIRELFNQTGIGTSQAATLYLRHRLVQRLAKINSPESELTSVAGTESGMFILEMIGIGPDNKNVRNVIQFLVKHLQKNQIGRFLKYPLITDELKVRVLALWIKKLGSLPPGCTYLWGTPQKDATEKPVKEISPLLGTALTLLDADTLKRAYLEEREKHGSEFLLALEKGISLIDNTGKPGAASSASENKGALESRTFTKMRELIDSLIPSVSQEDLLRLHQHYGSVFFTEYPGDVTLLGAQLDKVEEQLLVNRKEIPARLALLLSTREMLSEEVLVRVGAWDKCREAIKKILDLQGDLSTAKKCGDLTVLDQLCQKMSDSVLIALPESRLRTSLKKELAGTTSLDGKRILAARRREILASFAAAFSGKNLLPEGVWQHDRLWEKVEYCFIAGNWPAAKIKRLSSQAQKKRNMMIIILAGACVGLIAGLIWVFCLSGSSGNRPKETPIKNEGNGQESPQDTTPHESRPHLNSHQEKAENSEKDTAPVSSTKIDRNKVSVSPVEEEKQPEMESETPKQTTPTETPIPPDIKAEKTVQTFKITPRDVLNQWFHQLEKLTEKNIMTTRLCPNVTCFISDSTDPPRKRIYGELQDTGKILALDLKGLELQAGFLIYRGMAFPFGEWTPTPSAEDTDTSEASSEAPPQMQDINPRHSHVLTEDEDITFLQNQRNAVMVGGESSIFNVPGVQYEIRGLGRLLGLQAVIARIDIHHEIGAAYLEIRGIPKKVFSATGESLDKQQKKLTALLEELHHLKTQISNCTSGGAYGPKLEAELNKLAKYLNMDKAFWPDIQPRPLLKDYNNDKNVYAAALENYRRAEESRQKLVPALIQRSKEELKRREEEVSTLRAVLQRIKGEPTEEEQHALDALIQGCETVNVVVYNRNGIRMPEEGIEPIKTLNRPKDALSTVPFINSAPEEEIIKDKLPRAPVADPATDPFSDKFKPIRQIPGLKE